MNTGLRRIVLSCLMVLALAATLVLGCGKQGGAEGKVTITIGNMSDMTGPASTALVPINYLLDDIARYYNENNLVPGVEFKVIPYDGRYDPSRDIPGYDWLRGQGAQIIYSALPSSGETLKPFAAKDKVPLWNLNCTSVMVDPPGWVFCPNVPFKYDMKTLLKWVSENDWDYSKGIPKIGLATWDDASGVPYIAALKEYCQDHPDKFQLVAALTTPLGGMQWSAEVTKLKDCDYVYPPMTGTGLTTFLKEYLSAGGKAKLIGGCAQAAYRDLMVDTVGYAGINGMLFDLTTGRWWNEADTDPHVKLATELIYEYQTKTQADKIVYAGGLIGSFHEDCALFEIIAQTVKNVGAENFSGQAFYDTATKFSVKWESYETWNFTDTKRYMPNHTLMYKASTADNDLVRVSDWIPLLTEGTIS